MSSIFLTNWYLGLVCFVLLSSLIQTVAYFYAFSRKFNLSGLLWLAIANSFSLVFGIFDVMDRINQQTHWYSLNFLIYMSTWSILAILVNCFSIAAAISIAFALKRNIGA
jgi:hypothetical protein